MAHAPTPTRHEPPKHDPKHDRDAKNDRDPKHEGSHRDPAIVEGSRREPAKVVGQEGSLVMPLTEPAIGDKPLVGATGVKGEHIEDGERDPDTIAEEQRRRSEDYENTIGNEKAARLSPNDRTNEEQDALQHDPASVQPAAKEVSHGDSSSRNRLRSQQRLAG